MKCPVHYIDYFYTCPICEAELVYVGRFSLVDHFRAGVKGNQPGNRRGEELAAFNHGLKLGNWHRTRQGIPC